MALPDDGRLSALAFDRRPGRDVRGHGDGTESASAPIRTIRQDNGSLGHQALVGTGRRRATQDAGLDPKRPWRATAAAFRAKRLGRHSAYRGNPAAWRAPSRSAKDWTRTTRPSRTVKSEDRVSSTSSSCVRPTMCTTTAT
jgi:hypothetical protein